MGNGSSGVCFQRVIPKAFLNKLPTAQFELAQWKVATVQYNYHISVEKMQYSVPYEYIKQKVDVRLTKNMVEVFYKMRMSVMADAYRQQTEDPTVANLSFDERFAMVVDVEYWSRHNNRLKRNIH